MARAATRITLRHDDISAQRRWLDAVRSEPYTGMPRRLPRVTRPLPPAQAPQPLLFACLPELPRPPKSVELPRAVARPAEPATDTFTTEELAEIEAFFARSTLDTAAVKRWDAWISGGRSVHREIMRLPGVDGMVDIETIETRLGWGARVHFANRRDHLAHGSLSRPDYEKGRWFYWYTRDAAVAYCASRIWLTVSDTKGYGVRKERHSRLLAAEMQAFLGKVGIDVAAPPSASLRRVLVTEARRKELKAGASLAPFPDAPVAVETPAPAPEPAVEEEPRGLEPWELLARVPGGSYPKPTPQRLARLARSELRQKERLRLGQEALGKLVEAGMTTRGEHTLDSGAIRDKDAPFTPRSLSFPVRLVEIDGMVQLRLSTPAAGDLPFVKRIEEITGIRAEWRPRIGIEHDKIGLWYHATDLADDAGWKRLAATMEHTTPENVARAVGHHVLSGTLSVTNGRALLDAVCESAPADRSEGELMAMRPGSGAGPCCSLSGWGAVHAVEDGWLSIDKKRSCARFTAKARERIEALRPATAAVPPPTPAAPRLELTFDMGSFKDAHMLDRCDPGPDGYVVASPPFHLHDETHVNPMDKFLGQVVGIQTARALLFRRRDPDIVDGCEVGGRYVLTRFCDDETGEVWSMPVRGDDDAAVLQAIRETTALYRGHRPAPA